MCLLSLSGGTCGFSAPCHAAGCPSGVPHLADSGWLTYSCGDGFAWCWGCLSTDVLLSLVFLPCACAASPSAASPSGFCTLDSASLVTWVGLQPFPSFSVLLLLCLLAGVVGVLHPVSGCSSCGVVCLVCR